MHIEEVGTLSTVAKIATKKTTSEPAINIRLDDCHLGSCSLLQFLFKTPEAFEM